MFRGGGSAGGGRKGKHSLEFVKQTPKFLTQMREQIVKKENEEIEARISTLKKNTREREKEYDLENATIANPEGKSALLDQKNEDNEIKKEGLNKDFKPTFVPKNQKFNEKKEEILKKEEEFEHKIEKKESKNEDSSLGKRKALSDYVDHYLNEEDHPKDQSKKDKVMEKGTKNKKVKTNLLSFEN